MRSKTYFVAGCLALLAATNVQAAGPAVCSVKTRSAELIVLICTPGTDDRVWRTQSQAACALQNRCNVWIWDDASKSPQQAPQTDAEIPRNQALAAVAVWANDSQSLIKLKRVAR